MYPWQRTSIYLHSSFHLSVHLSLSERAAVNGGLISFANERGGLYFYFFLRLTSSHLPSVSFEFSNPAKIRENRNTHAHKNEYCLNTANSFLLLLFLYCFFSALTYFYFVLSAAGVDTTGLDECWGTFKLHEFPRGMDGLNG